jgi:hypothetical protein
MKTVFFLLMALNMTTHAGDFVMIAKVPGMTPNATNTVLAQIEGPHFEAVRAHVEKVVAALGANTNWGSCGPDAWYFSAKIGIGDKTYTIRSWHPLYRNSSTIAVSEKRGLMSVAGRQEKEKIESQNSERYKTLVSIFDFCTKEKP